MRVATFSAAISLCAALFPGLSSGQSNQSSATDDSQSGAPAAPGAHGAAQTLDAVSLEASAETTAFTYEQFPPMRREARSVEYLGGPVPTGMQLVTSRNRALLALGSIGFGAVYLGNAVFASVCSGAPSCNQGLGWLFVPLAGPFMALTYPQASENVALLVADGVLQVGALAVAIVGMMNRRLYLAPDPFAEGTHSRASMQWSVTPGAANALAGATFSLTHF